MFEQILAYDKELLLLINGAHSQMLDTAMLFISTTLGWLPLYFFLLYIIIKDYGRKTWLILFIIALTLLLSDQISVQLFKNTFQRLRPCYEDSLTGLLHLVKYCGGKYGFVSSHATNSFGIVTLVILLLRKKQLWIWPVMLIYGLLIIYSRVYLGVHYPTDVIAGSITGVVIGTSTYLLFRYICHLNNREKD
jgi:undecaprenyl-diphosphatase